LAKTGFVVLVLSVVFVDGCANHELGSAHHLNLPGAPDSPQVLAVYMPWFGDRNHIDVGYSSQDATVLQRQIQEARSMGVTAFVVDWYGDRDPFLDRSFALLQQAAKDNHFHVALMYDETEDDNGEATEDAIRALRRAYAEYIGPSAPHGETYLTYNGRPLIFVFPKQGHTHWDSVRKQLNTWGQPPLLIYKDQPPAEFDKDFDGSYPWVHPGKSGWSADGSDWGKDYLDGFYDSMKKRPGKIAVGAAWPAFDDSRAPWGLNRHIDGRCGRTLEDTLDLSLRFRDSGNALPFLLLETWNDYEEGTALEQRSFTKCKANGKG
jgi:hypothetical protein